MTTDSVDPQQPNHLQFKPEPVGLPSNYEEDLDREMMLDFIAQNMFRLDEEDGVQQLLATAAFHEHAMQTLNQAFPVKSDLTPAAGWVNELIRRRAELPGAFVTALPSAPNREHTEMVQVVTTKFENLDELIATVRGCLEAQERVYLYGIVTTPDNKPMLRWLHY